MGQVETYGITNKQQGVDVAILIHDLRGGGAERAMLRLARGMRNSGRAVDLWLVQMQGEYLQDIPLGVSVRCLNGSSVAAATPKLAGWLARRPPRALLSALTHVNIAAIAAGRLAGYRGRLVVSERNQISKMAGAAASRRQRLTYAAARRLYRSADAVVAVSQGVADDVRSFSGLPQDRLRVIYNPVVDETFGVDAGEPEHPWLTDGGPPVLLAAGRLKPQKGFDDLLHAFAEVRQQRPARLVVLGEGPERAKLEDLAQGLGVAADVSLPGFCERPVAAMRRAAVFVLPSHWEGFPNALVEAMAAGAPVVACDCPSGPREILADGAFGRLTPVADRPALARALLDALDQPGERGRVMARAACFSVAAAANSYLDVLGV